MMVPDSAHGTNPATANMIGFDVIEVKSNPRGLVDLDDLKSKMNEEVAGLMLTNPNTLGLFEEEIEDIAAIVHEAGGLLYYDGPNLNGEVGVARPGDMGFDLVHVNLHKPSVPERPDQAGRVKSPFVAFPYPWYKRRTIYSTMNTFHQQGKKFLQQFGVIVKAYAYIKAGWEGLKDDCQNAVLNANYMRHQLREDYNIPMDRLCKHEFIINSKKQADPHGISTMDIAKRLIDYGYHPPTVYFPLIISEAMMIEPTETESKERMDDFIAAMKSIAKEAKGSVLRAHYNHSHQKGRRVKAATNQ